MNHKIVNRMFLLLVLFFVGLSQGVDGQNIAVKSNILSDVLLTPNIGIEVGMAPKWTIDVSGQFNAWTLSHMRRWKHVAMQPEVRYWFCDRFSGHFIGMHLHGGWYNIGGFDGKMNMFGTDARKLKDTRYQGWFAGAGVAYGYAWILGRHWNLEAELGFGYSFTKYDRFRCAGCGKKVETDKTHHYIGPTKLAINLVYVF